MKPNRTWTRFVLLVFAAILGAWLIFLPAMIADQYDRVSSAGSFWGTLYIVSVSSGGVILLICSVWIVWKLWSRGRIKKKRRIERDRNPSQMSKGEQSSEIAENLKAIDDLREDEHLDVDVKHELEPIVERFEEKQESERLEIVAFGTVSSGKSAVLNLLAGREAFRSDAKGGTTVTRSEVDWPGSDQVILVDTPGLGEIDGAEHVAIAADAAKDADLVLLVIDGPLRDHESLLLDKLADMEKRVIVCLNKTDWYEKDDIEKLQEQLGGQLDRLVDRKDLVTVQAAPTKRMRVRILPDGSEVEEEVDVEANLDFLSQRMLAVVKQEGKSLLMANLLLQSRGLLEQARETVKQSLDRQAWKIVDRYTWSAGGAAALSPLPIVDLVAGCAISSKMVLDLSKVYRQDMDLDAAVSLLGQLGKNLIGILGVSAATPAVTSLFASMLKAVPGAGTIAGGLLQGCVQALITRWIGAIFVEYFRNEMHEPEGGLAGLARRQWQQMTTIGELRKLITKARQELRGGEDLD